MSLISLEDKIFIAGHKGMAGSAICRSLYKKGYVNQLKLNRDELDLLDYEAVRNWFLINKPNVVIIAAAKVGGIHANKHFPVDFLLENLKIQNNIIENSWKSGVNRLLFLGSSCIYPKFADQPIIEESLLKNSLESTNESYAIAKIAGIKLCAALRQQHDFNAISLMPTNLYGPGDNYHKMNSHVLPALIRRFYEAKLDNAKELTCWGSGSPLREFLHVDDLGEACVYALERWDPKKNAFPNKDTGQELSHLNVGTGNEVTIYNLANKISEIVGFKGKIIWDSSKPDGTPRKLLDVSRMNQLGWKAKINLDFGLEITFKSFVDQYKNGVRI